jgi:membrane protease YdiL (CAAX protease family)
MFLGVAGLALLVWGVIITRLVRREPLAPLWPRRAVPWPWWLMATAFLIYFSVIAAAAGGARAAAGGPNAKLTELPLESRMAVMAVAGIASTVLIVFTLRTGCGATTKDLGLQTHWLSADVKLGLAGFLAVAPVILFIKWLLLPYAESSHPIEEAMTKQPGPALMFWIVMAAVVAAPFVEEFLLRVVFQGWLERICFRGTPPAGSAALTSAEPEAWLTGPHDLADSASTLKPNPYAAPPEHGPPSASEPPSSKPDGATVSTEPTASADEQVVPTGLRGAAPILISSTVFAGMHYGNGIDPFPLFVLALVLGWIYQRTHRLWPCVSLHMALNSISVAMLFLARRPA